MPGWPGNPLLKLVGIGTVGEHLGVVVALQQHGVQRGNHVAQAGEDVAQIGQDAQPVPAVIDHEHHPLCGVVRGGSRFHDDFAETDRFPGLEMPKVSDLAKGKSLGRLVGLGGGVDWQAEGAVQDSHTAAVVNMVVGDENRIDRIYVPAMLGEPLFDIAGTDPGVEQQLDAACLDVDAVAVAAGLEGDELHGDIVLHHGLS